MSVVRVNTFTHTTTHIAANIVLCLKRLVRGCGLDIENLAGRWTSTETAIATWLEGKYLTAAMLEVWDPTRQGEPLVGRFDFDVDYAYYGDGDGELWVDPATVAAVIRKNGSYPSTCCYRIVCDVKQGAPLPSGWGWTTLRSTDGMTRHSVGAAMGGGSIGASLTYYRRSAS